MSKQLIIKNCWGCPYRKTQWIGAPGIISGGTKCIHPDVTSRINLDMPPYDTTHEHCPLDDYIDYKQYVATAC